MKYAENKNVYECLKDFSTSFKLGLHNVDHRYRKGQLVKLLNNSAITNKLISNGLIKKFNT